jgi:hypothetical protein
LDKQFEIKKTEAFLGGLKEELARLEAAFNEAAAVLVAKSKSEPAASETENDPIVEDE